jgi:photosystem II stability/assembly factor-like uncharacterized protein
MFLILFLSASFSYAQDSFTRVQEIPFPESDINYGGTGNMVSGVDLDGDGRTEIYLVNDNWNDFPEELIPRIYKLEWTGSGWDTVWQAVAPVLAQNTWPTLNVADLDKDEKAELIWCPANNFASETNPYRLLVYEVAGDGSDVLGVADGDNYLPNSKWTVAGDSENMRIMDLAIADPDGDGTDEVIFADRAGNSAGYYFGVASVSDIPDNGDGSETWTLEVSGKDFGDLAAEPIENKWDVAVVGNNCYFFCEIEISKLSWTGSEWTYTALSPMLGGGSIHSSQVLDLDGDEEMEIIVAVYDWGEDAHKAILLLQEDGDSLRHTELVNVASFWPSGSRGMLTSAMGDIDQDGNMDFVFGSRNATPNAAIFRLEYQGGDITDGANYELTIIDSLFDPGENMGIWDVINVANIDDDPELEVLYTSSIAEGSTLFDPGFTEPIVVLDYSSGALEFDELIVAPEVLFDGEPPVDMYFRPGRILNKNTIWFGARSGSNTYVFRSIDGGATFTHNAEPLEGRMAQLDAFDANTAIVAMDIGKIYRTTNGGVDWTEVYSYEFGFLQPGWFDGLRVLNENVAVAYGDGANNGDMQFVRTDNKGETWTEIEGIDYLSAYNGYYTWGLGACNVDESIWCTAYDAAGDTAFVFRSYDAGINWDSYLIPEGINPIGDRPRSVAFTNDNNGLITTDPGYVIKTTDGGANWMTTNNPDAPSTWVNGVAAIPNTDIIVGFDDVGVFYTTDLGETWGEITTPPETDTDYFLSGLFYGTDMGYVFTDNGLVLRFKDQVTAISDPELTNIPKTYRLSQNYPNPFNPETKISFTIPKAGDVTIKVYDIQGREVTTLVNASMNAGAHEVVWNGTNASGARVASGMYVYTMKSADRVLSKKMVLMK